MPCRCIPSSAIVNVSRGEGAITSRRKQKRSRPDSAGGNSGTANSSVHLPRRGRRLCAGHCNLLGRSADWRSNQGVAVASPRTGGVRFDRPKEMERGDAKAREAYLLRPTEPESWRAIARLASRTSQTTAALEWWKRVDDVHRLTFEDRRDFAGAALAAGELATAGTQIEQLLAQRQGTAPIDILLAGQLAVRRSNAFLTVDYAERTLADKRARPYEILSAAILVLSSRTLSRPSH